MSGDSPYQPGGEHNVPGNSVFYGYVTVACSFVIMLVIFGTNYSFGVFFDRLLEDFGWSRVITSTGYAISQLLGGVMGILTGRLSDRLGPRFVVMICALTMAAGCILMSRVSQPWHLYFFYGVLMGFGVGGASIPLSSNISRWFVKRRGLMTGIVVAGIGTGTILMPPLVNIMVENFGWRQTFIILGIAVLAVVIPLSMLLRRQTAGNARPDSADNASSDHESAWRHGNGLTFRQAMSTPSFWIICTLYVCFGFYVQSVMVHIVPYARTLGIEAGSAAMIMSFLGAGSILGRIVMGSLSDRLGVKYTLAFSLSLLLLTFIWLQAAGSLWQLYLFAAFYGFGYGSMIAQLTLAPAKLFGLVSLGTLVGVVTCVYTVGGSVGPIVSGYIYDISGSYRSAFIFFIALAAAGLAMALCLRLSGKRERG
ncbi:MAG: MFS transporter [Dehalococcoidales bacterium]|nr:MFS transporter [Dehalococcoidales bacterium]